MTAKGPSNPHWIYKVGDKVAIVGKYGNGNTHLIGLTGVIDSAHPGTHAKQKLGVKYDEPGHGHHSDWYNSQLVLLDKDLNYVWEIPWAKNAPLIKEADPELEALLAEEEAIEKFSPAFIANPPEFNVGDHVFIIGFCPGDPNYSTHNKELHENAGTIDGIYATNSHKYGTSWGITFDEGCTWHGTNHVNGVYSYQMIHAPIVEEPVEPPKPVQSGDRCVISWEEGITQGGKYKNLHGATGLVENSTSVEKTIKLDAHVVYDLDTVWMSNNTVLHVHADPAVDQLAYAFNQNNFPATHMTQVQQLAGRVMKRLNEADCFFFIEGSNFDEDTFIINGSSWFESHSKDTPTDRAVRALHGAPLWKNGQKYNNPNMLVPSWHPYRSHVAGDHCFTVATKQVLKYPGTHAFLAWCLMQEGYPLNKDLTGVIDKAKDVCDYMSSAFDLQLFKTAQEVV